MGEKRLLEITSTICKFESTLDIMKYVSTFNESDIYLFLKYVGSSRYNGMELSRAIHKFSCDYLASKGIFLDSEVNIVEENNEILSDQYRIIMANN